MTQSNNPDSGDNRWRESLELIGKIRSITPHANCVYRGESRRFKEVSSGLYRELQEAVNSGVPLQVLEDQEIRLAKNYVGGGNQSGVEDIEILSAIQHYGGKTNLVDFTSDLNIALFFACDGAYSRDGRILVLEKADSEDQRFHEPKGPADRAPAQKSVLVHPTNGLVKGCLEVPIPSELKLATLEYLEKAHRINRQTVYSGPLGFIKFRERHRLAQSHLIQGMREYNEGNPSASIQHCNDALDEDHLLEEAYRCRGLAHHAKEEYDHAISDLKRALDLAPHLHCCRVELGDVYSDKSNYKRALEWYDNALDKPMPVLNKADCLNRRGIARIKAGDYAVAIFDYSQAIELCQPRPAGAQQAILRSLSNDQHRKRFQEIDAYNRQLHAIALCNRGEARLHLQQWTLARDDLAEASSKGIDTMESIVSQYGTIEELERTLGRNLPPEIRSVLKPNFPKPLHQGYDEETEHWKASPEVGY